jgi:alpha-L-fucosidase
MDYIALEDLIIELDAIVGGVEPTDNTGFYSKKALTKLQEALDLAMQTGPDASYEEISAAYNALNSVYEDFKVNGTNPGGAPMQGEIADVTIDVLSEVDNFSRSEEGSLGVRYGTPLYWTVENYNIPAGGQGNRNGIDSYPGYDCLSLGVWNDAGSNTDGNLANARIYQRVTLQPGRYYFGASYNTTYAISDESYIFVASETMPTADIPENSIAYYHINKAPDNNDGSWHGLFFTLEEEAEVVIGFQSNLAKGSSTKEFRVKGVKLLYYGEITYAKLEQLINLLGEQLKEVKINDNTGHYSAGAYEEFAAILEQAKAINPDASLSDISAAYTALNEAYTHFLTEGKNKSGIAEEIGATDITEEYLIESEDFSRLDPSVTTRFTYPLYWTTENFGIESFTEGTRGGLDKWPGYDCLAIGVWNDKENSPEGSDLTNSRLYRRISLPAGRYFFGAAYDAVFNMNLGYLYVADATLNTTDIERQAIAYHKISEAPISDNIHGLYFTLDQPQELVIAFQVDIANGPSAQEFRAKRLALLSYSVGTGIDSVENGANAVAPDFNAPAQYYSVTGVQLNAAPRQGMFIMRQGGNTFKVYRK